LEQQRLVARKGTQLSREEVAATKRVADEYQKARQKLGDLTKQSEIAEAFTEKAPAILDDIQAKASGTKGFLSYMDEAYAKAQERIAARRGRLYTGFDPVALADEVIVGARHISHGINNFAVWSKKMLAELGERIRPYLKDLFDHSRKMHEAGLKIANENAAMDKRLKTYGTRQARRETFEQSRLDMAKEMVKAGKRIAGLAEKPTRRKLELDQQHIDTNMRIDDLKREFFEMVARDKRTHATPTEKAKMIGYETLAIPRALKASLDVSALRRQGGAFFASRPLTAMKAFGRTISTIVPGQKGEKAFNVLVAKSKLRENYRNGSYDQAKLATTELGGTARLSKTEEMFASNVIDRIPVLRHIIRPSERAYTAFLNELRMDTYDSLAASVSKKPGGKLTLEEKRAVGNLVNVFTGRGSLPGTLDYAAGHFNQMFFAPRYVASRFQTLLGQPLLGKQMRAAKSARVAKVLGTEYARMIGGYMTQYALVAAFAQAMGGRFGDMVSFDPRSTDFGKIRIGDTRIDPMAGLSQVTVLLSRFATGEIKTLKGAVEPLRGPEVGYGKPRGEDILKRFLRSKLAPIPAALYDRFAAGQTFTGEEISGVKTLPAELMNLISPLSGSDIYQALREQGLTRESALYGLAVFGDSVQTYSPKVQTEKQRLREQMKNRIKIIP
jgi:hypothetical protein